MREHQFIPIGRVIAPWGIRGEVKVEAMTDFLDRFSRGEMLYLRGQATTIESSKYRGDTIILKLDAVGDRSAAEQIRDAYLEIPSTKMKPLPEGEYYRFQLLGLAAWSTDGKLLGCISDIITTGSNDVYEISSSKGSFLIPAIDDVVKSIDLDNGRMTIKLIKGLL